MEALIQAVDIYSKDIGMEFGKEKCAMLIMKSGRRQMTEVIEQPNKRKIRTLGEKETYKHFGILEADIIKYAEMKEKIKKRNFKRTIKLLETKQHSRNFIKEINTWELFLKWTREELKQMDQM